MAELTKNVPFQFEMSLDSIESDDVVDIEKGKKAPAMTPTIW